MAQVQEEGKRTVSACGAVTVDDVLGVMHAREALEFLAHDTPDAGRNHRLDIQSARNNGKFKVRYVRFEDRNKKVQLGVDVENARKMFNCLLPNVDMKEKLHLLEEFDRLVSAASSLPPVAAAAAAPAAIPPRQKTHAKFKGKMYRIMHRDTSIKNVRLRRRMNGDAMQKAKNDLEMYKARREDALNRAAQAATEADLCYEQIQVLGRKIDDYERAALADYHLQEAAEILSFIGSGERRQEAFVNAVESISGLAGDTNILFRAVPEQPICVNPLEE